MKIKIFQVNNIAYIKLKLGDIFLSEGKKWDAILFYSQVEKEFKNDIIGQEAKLKKKKLTITTVISTGLKLN